MSNISKIVAITLVAIALAACGNSGTGTNDQAQAPVPAPATEPVAEPVAAPVVEPTMENLPGTYSGTLPCGDCKGVITKLELIADGSYKVNEIFDGKGEGSMLDSDGKWSFDSASRRVTLDPTAQDWQDRVFEATGTAALRPLDGNSVPYSTEGLNDLHLVK